MAGLRRERDRLSKEREAARTALAQASTDRTLAEERVRHSKQALDVAIASRDQAVAAFPEGLEQAAAAARSAVAGAGEEMRDVAARFAALENEIEERRTRIEKALSETQDNERQAKAAVDAADTFSTAAKARNATEQGRFLALHKQLAAEDMEVAEAQLRGAVISHDALPVPAREVSEDEVNGARRARDDAKGDVGEIERQMDRARGALEQVGGAVARERLRDAEEAFELAERNEKDVEAEYEAWNLLLEQLKAADAAHASNLGQALAPKIEARFKELSRERYEGMQLSAELATNGIVASGAVRPVDQLSVGTREQLSTLYRLSLAEYLHSTIVLDDQLVQSDDHRMEWFRAMLVEKASEFQIVVVTCRPADYLGSAGVPCGGNASHVDHENGLIRSIDLQRALSRRKARSE